MRVLIMAGLIAATLPGAAQAQQTTVAAQVSVEVARVARGLEAQYQAALIRERRLADDRELRLIADGETRLKAARAQADQRVAGAQAELDAARAAYAELVGGIALRDAASRAEIEAYKAEAQGLAAQATPERLAALQRFADGDRVGAWPVLEALRLAEDRAIESAPNARRAVRWRQDAELREIMRVNGEATTASVLALWDEAGRLDPRDFDTHLARARLAQAMNDLERAQAVATEAQTAAKSDDERRLAAEESGNIAVARNNLPEALRQYRFALETTRRLERENRFYRRESTVYLNNVADVLRAQGDLPGALANYREGLEIRRALARDDPSNAKRRRDLTVSLNKVADVLRAQSDLPGALANYREGLEIRRALARDDPSNAERRRDLTVSLSKVADVLRAQSDLPGALANDRESLEIARALARDDPSNAEHRRDLTVSLDRIGDVLSAQSDLPGALANYREGLEIRRALARDDPSNAERRRDLSVSLNKVADVLRAQSDLPGALANYQEGLEIARALARDDPSNAERRRDIAVSLERLGLVAKLSGDKASARRYWTEEIDIMNRLRSQGDHPGLVRFVAVVHSFIADLGEADAREQLGRCVEMLQQLERINRLNPRDTPMLRRLESQLKAMQ